MKHCLSALALVACALAAPSAEAASTYGFFGITDNNATNTTIGESQLQMTVSSGWGNKVNFRFDNLGPLASSITDVYFDDRGGLFSGISRIRSSWGVNFSEGAAPGNLPGGNTLADPFQTSLGLSADADAPVQKNGVNPGEWLLLSLSLNSGSSFSSVINSINSAALRVGLHVQGFSNGGSESFVNTNPGGPPPLVPEPSSLALAGLALAGLFVRRVRRRPDQPEAANEANELPRPENSGI